MQRRRYAKEEKRTGRIVFSAKEPKQVRKWGANITPIKWVNDFDQTHWQPQISPKRAYVGVFNTEWKPYFDDLGVRGNDPPVLFRWRWQAIRFAEKELRYQKRQFRPDVSRTDHNS
jgi:hypothetical protein